MFRDMQTRLKTQGGRSGSKSHRSAHTMKTVSLNSIRPTNYPPPA